MANTRPFIRVIFPNIGTVMSPIEGELHQEEYKHSLYKLTFREAPYNFSSIRSGEPVQIQYGYSPKAYTTEYAYFTNSNPEFLRQTQKTSLETTQHFRNVKTLFLGVSWPLKERSLDTWKSLNPHNLIQLIAQKFHLSSNLSTVLLLRDFFQNGNSYWKLLCNIADEYGMSLTTRGTEISWVRRSDIVKSQKFIPIITPKNIVRFIPEYGVNTPTGGNLSSREAHSIDVRSGELISSGTQPNLPALSLGSSIDDFVFNDVVSVPMHSTEEMNVRVDAANERNRYYIQAKVEILGVSNIRAGSLVEIRGLKTKDNGVWFVHKTNHHFALNEQSIMVYHTDMVLGRDSFGQFQQNRPQNTRYITSQDGSHAQGTPPALLINNRWGSPWYWNVING